MYVILVLILLFLSVGEKCKRKMNIFGSIPSQDRTTGPEFLVVPTYFLVASDVKTLEYCYSVKTVIFKNILKLQQSDMDNKPFVSIFVAAYFSFWPTQHISTKFLLEKGQVSENCHLFHTLPDTCSNCGEERMSTEETELHWTIPVVSVSQLLHSQSIHHHVLLRTTK